MGNPYAPTRWRESSEVASDLDVLLNRLSLLGASQDELDTVRDGWDQLDDDWTVESRAAFARRSDEDLIAAIKAVRDEYAHGTTTEDEAAARQRAADELVAVSEARDRIGQTVADLLAWVDEDDVSLPRAWAVRLVESESGAPRKTLLEAVRTGAEAWDKLRGPAR